MLTKYSDTHQYSLLSGSDPVVTTSEQGPTQDGIRACTCTNAMPGCSIHPNTQDAWTRSMRASLALILASPAMEKASTEIKAGCGPRSHGLLAYFDHLSSTLKTAQQSLVEDSTGSYLTLPRWGTMQNGYVYPLIESVRPMRGTDGGVLLPTLTVNGNYNRKGLTKDSGDGLVTALKKLPTLKARDGRTHGGEAELRRNNPALPALIGGPLNPTWAEWFMGWPMGLTALKRLATGKSRSKRR